MVKTYLYIPEELNRKIEQESKKNRKNKAEMIRNLISIGLSVSKKDNKDSVNALINLKRAGEKLNIDTPHDLSSDMDNCLWNTK